jgi:hypothetical protein
MGGEFDAPEEKGGLSILKGMVPAAEVKDYAETLAAYTQGLGRLQLTLHGYAPCHNQAEVVAAIGSHTTGRPGMSTLEQIIYIADNMERTRTYPGVEKVRELAFRDLTAAVKLGLSNTIENLKTRAEGIHPQGLATLAWLNERKSKIC